jgi:hypothetical protein
MFPLKRVILDLSAGDQKIKKAQKVKMPGLGNLCPPGNHITWLN